MSDILGDLDAIIRAKRHDTALLFVTDGMTWKARLADLRRIVRRQNEGQITRIYTTKMREIFLDDLRTLKNEFAIDSTRSFGVARLIFTACPSSSSAPWAADELHFVCRVRPRPDADH